MDRAIQDPMEVKHKTYVSALKTMSADSCPQNRTNVAQIQMNAMDASILIGAELIRHHTSLKSVHSITKQVTEQK